jgi:CRP-like cAMP-binding protein
METLFQKLNAIYPLSGSLKDYLVQNLKEKKLRKKELLLKAGRICSNTWFVENGLLRCYYVKDDKEVNTWFMKEGDVITSVESFFDQKPGYESIQALENCTLYYITYNELQYAYKNFLEFNYIGRELVQQYYKLSEKRLYSMRYTAGVERMAFLLANHRDLIGRVEDQHLASYLDLRRQYFCILKPEELKRKTAERKNTCKKVRPS